MALDENKGACSSDLYSIEIGLLLSKLFFWHLSAMGGALAGVCSPMNEPSHAGTREHECAVERSGRGQRIGKAPRSKACSLQSAMPLRQLMRVIGHDIDI